MVARPTSSELTQSETKTLKKPRHGQLADFLGQLPGADPEAEITLASDVATPTRFAQRVDTQADAASDDLKQAVQANLPDGSLLLLAAEDPARVVTVKHLNGTGTPGTAGEFVLTNNEDFALDEAAARLLALRKGAQWIELLAWKAFGQRLLRLANAAALRTLGDLAQTIANQTENSAPALSDFLAMAVGGQQRKVQLANALKAINGASALTAIAADDKIFIFDLSAGAVKSIVPAELLKALGLLSEETTPDKDADFLLLYDTSTGTVKKVKPGKLGGLDPTAKSEFYEEFLTIDDATAPGAGADRFFGSGKWRLQGASPADTEGGVLRVRGDGTNNAGAWPLHGGGLAAPWRAAHDPELTIRAAQEGAGGNPRRVGLMGTPTLGGSDPSNGIFFRHANGGNIFGVCRSGGAETVLDTGVAAANGTYRTLKCAVSGAGASVEFFVDGVSKGTISTNIPSAALGFVINAADTQPNGLSVGFVHIKQNVAP